MLKAKGWGKTDTSRYERKPRLQSEENYQWQGGALYSDLKKKSVHQKDVAILNMCTPNNKLKRIH